jgi:hypothetical protein
MQKLVSLLLLFLSFSASAQFKSQLELIKKFPSGNYTVYRFDNRKLDKLGKLWPITINMGSNGLVETVLVKRSGVIDEEFKPDLKEQPGYFAYDNTKLMFLENYAVYYKQSTDYSGNTVYDILYEFIPEGGGPQDMKDASADIAAYRKATLNSQSGTRADIAKNQAETEAKERAENSTKGKTVKSLKYQAADVPQQLGLYSKIKFGVIATLADGKELKTKSIGGKSDFDDSYIVDAPGCTFADGVLEVGADATAFPNDEIVLTIKNLNNPSQSITEKITLNYNNAITIKGGGESGSNAYSGSSGNSGCPPQSGKSGSAGQAGQSGCDFNIKIKETKHKITGTTLYLVEINQSRVNKTMRFKCTPEAKLSLIAFGGSGGDGGGGGTGGNSLSSCPGSGRAGGGNGGSGATGGNGGNLNITKASSNISTSFITITNNGGLGGRAGKGGNGGISGSNGSQGSAGRDGTTTTNTGAVSINW